MEGAKKSIYLEMYIFENEVMDFDIAKVLMDQAMRGVKVKMILDYWGSFHLSSKATNELKMAGVELFFLSHWLHRAHRKILIIDEQLAFVGGVNFSHEARLWNDLMMRVQGRLVKFFVRAFARTYENCGGRDVGIISQYTKTAVNKKNSWLIEHSPLKRNFYLKKIYKDYLRQAEKRVILITPYFMPGRWLISAMHQAVLRGVIVEVLVPKTTDYFLLDRVNYFFLLRASRLGISCYLSPSMNHAKAMIIDEREGIIGSNNLDILSFEFNSEIGVLLKDARAVQKLLKIMNQWKQEATLFNVSSFAPKWFDYMLSPIISFFVRTLRI